MGTSPPTLDLITHSPQPVMQCRSGQAATQPLGLGLGAEGFKVDGGLVPVQHVPFKTTAVVARQPPRGAETAPYPHHNPDVRVCAYRFSRNRLWRPTQSRNCKNRAKPIGFPRSRQMSAKTRGYRKTARAQIPFGGNHFSSARSYSASSRMKPMMCPETPTSG